MTNLDSKKFVVTILSIVSLTINSSLGKISGSEYLAGLGVLTLGYLGINIYEKIKGICEKKI